MNLICSITPRESSVVARQGWTVQCTIRAHLKLCSHYFWNWQASIYLDCNSALHLTPLNDSKLNDCTNELLLKRIKLSGFSDKERFMSRATLESTKIISTITKFTSKAAALLAVNHAERINADWGVSWRWENFIKIRLIAVVIQREIVETGAKIWLHTILLSRIYLSRARLLSTRRYQTLLSGSLEASPAESNLELSSDISSSLSDNRFPSRFNYKPFKAIRSNLIFMLNPILDDETKLTIVWALKWIGAHFATLTGWASFVIRHNALFENSHDSMSGRKLFYFNRLWNIEFSLPLTHQFWWRSLKFLKYLFGEKVRITTTWLKIRRRTAQGSKPRASL